MWELWLPLLIVGATMAVGGLIYFAAKKLLFEGRARDYPEEAHRGSPH